jgi:hypothetical protein
VTVVRHSCAVCSSRWYAACHCAFSRCSCSTRSFQKPLPLFQLLHRHLLLRDAGGLVLQLLLQGGDLAQQNLLLGLLGGQIGVVRAADRGQSLRVHGAEGRVGRCLGGAVLVPRLHRRPQCVGNGRVLQRVEQQIRFLEDVHRRAAALVGAAPAPVVHDEQVDGGGRRPALQRQVQRQFAELRHRPHGGGVSADQRGQNGFRGVLPPRRLVQRQALPQRPVEGGVDRARGHDPDRGLFRMRLEHGPGAVPVALFDAEEELRGALFSCKQSTNLLCCPAVATIMQDSAL